MRDYDSPEKPADTPPVIDSHEDRSESAQAKVEKALRPAQDGGREGAGEAALDSPSSE